MGTVLCVVCEKRATSKNAVKMDLYDTPWDDVPRKVWVHNDNAEKLNHYGETCIDLLYDTSWADFRYFDCVECGRTICEQNPANGWHSQVRYDECDEPICLRCYEQEILANGVPAEKFEKGALSGMFFSYGNKELAEAGYELIPEVDDRHIACQSDSRQVCDIALAEIAKGHKVIVAYESMAIGGLEGYVSLFSKAA